jgi:hypothetical protein
MLLPNPGVTDPLNKGTNESCAFDLGLRFREAESNLTSRQLSPSHLQSYGKLATELTGYERFSAWMPSAPLSVTATYVPSIPAWRSCRGDWPSGKNPRPAGPILLMLFARMTEAIPLTSVTAVALDNCAPVATKLTVFPAMGAPVELLSATVSGAGKSEPYGVLCSDPLYARMPVLTTFTETGELLLSRKAAEPV